jgi:hypothetical protein
MAEHMKLAHMCQKESCYEEETFIAGSLLSSSELAG